MWAHRAERGGPKDSNGSIEGFRVRAVMESFAVASSGGGDWWVMGGERWVCPVSRS